MKAHVFFLYFICCAITSEAQHKAKLISKDDFRIPSINKYSIVIKAPKDTAYCFYSIFMRAYDSKISGVYVEMQDDKVKFESFLSDGKLSGLYRRYDEAGLLRRYGKYLDNTLIEDNEIIYDSGKNIIEVKQTFPGETLKQAK